MFGEVDIEQFADSQYAIQDYIHSGQTRDEKWGSHIDTVMVIKNGETIFKENLTVISLIETNESFVEIIWPPEYEDRFWMKYSNRFQPFEYEAGRLVINWKEKNGDKISIFIG